MALLKRAPIYVCDLKTVYHYHILDFTYLTLEFSMKESGNMEESSVLFVIIINVENIWLLILLD